MSKVKKSLIILIIAILVSMFNGYGNGKSLNSGVTFGISESCQIGYEFAGTPGFFAYCELRSK